MRSFLSTRLSIESWNLLRDLVLLGWFLGGTLRFSSLIAQENPWMVGEWLIDYSDGFGRRGLAGEILWTLSLGNWHSAQIILGVLYAALLALQICLTRILLLSKPSIGRFALLFSPGAFLVFVADPGYSGRKEILIFILSLLTVWMIRNRAGSIWDAIVYTLLWILLGLTHEGLLVFAPVIGTFFLLDTPSIFTRLRRRIFFLLPSFVALGVGLTLLLVQSGRSAEATCLRWLSSGASEQICQGAVDWIDRNEVSFALKETANAITSDHVFLFGFYIAFTTMLLIYFSRREICHPTRALLASLGLLAGSFVIIASLSVDWGRWINVSTVLALIMIVISTERPNALQTIRRKAEIRYSDVILITSAYLLIAPPHFGTRIQSPLLTIYEGLQLVGFW